MDKLLTMLFLIFVVLVCAWSICNPAEPLTVAVKTIAYEASS